MERFNEPMLLLLLRERPTHGYELLEQLESLTNGEHVDVGNLYRVLRALEEQGVVKSEWDADAPGPAKRIYELTDEGRALLDTWADSLRTAQENVAAFLARYEDGRR